MILTKPYEENISIGDKMFWENYDNKMLGCSAKNFENLGEIKIVQFHNTYRR